MKWRTGGAALTGVLGLGMFAGFSRPLPASESASYRLLQASAGCPAGGGVRVGGTGIELDGSTGDAVAGVAGGESAGGVRVIPNFTGQLYDPRELEVSAVPAVVDEGGTRQMQAELVMDDESVLPVLADGVAWSEGSIALDGISVGGLVTAATVYQDETAVVNGSWQDVADPDGFELTVLNTGTDDFEGYAGDGLDDDWQVGYFGLPPNADAAPGVDADFDGQDNRFEFLSGFSPVDSTARFILTIVDVDRAAGTTDLRLNRMMPGRTYTLLSSPDLVSPFEPVGTVEPVDVPTDDVIVQDPAAAQPRNFYIIGISKP